MGVGGGIEQGGDIIRTLHPEMYGELITSLFLLEDTEYCLQAEVRREGGGNLRKHWVALPPSDL